MELYFLMVLYLHYLLVKILQKIGYRLEYTFFIGYYFFYLDNMSNSEICNTRNAGMKQEIPDMKNDFMKSLDSLKLDINNKFNNINDKLVTIKSGFKENLDDLVLESLSKIKDSIIEALREENSFFTKRLKNLRVEFQCWKLI